MKIKQSLQIDERCTRTTLSPQCNNKYEKKILFTTLILMTCSMQANTNWKIGKDYKVDSITKLNEFAIEKKYPLINKSVKFLWRINIYDKELKSDIPTIMINDSLCKSLSEQERAALGFAVTFIGSDCDWDGEAKDDRSNLKCKALTALNLGYQCSEKHLGFLRKWFANDSNSINKLKYCPTTPFTATRQETFDYINLNVNGNLISVDFGVSGASSREDEPAWSWTETNYFRVDNESIILIKIKKTKSKALLLNTNV